MESKDYWEEAVPWTFHEKPELTYKEKRLLRYQLQDYMKDVIPFRDYRGKRVLELGCGSGIDALEFASNFAFVTALDFTDKSMVECQKNLRQAHIFPNPTFIKNDFSKGLPPFAPKLFDLVYSFGVLHHIKEPEPVIQSSAKVLSDDGKMIVMLYNRDSLLYAYSIEHLGLSTERMTGCPYTRAYFKFEAEAMFLKYFGKVKTTTCYKVIDTRNERKVKFQIPEYYEVGWHLILECTNPLRS